MNELQFALLRQYASRLLQCAPSQVAVSFFDMDVTKNLIPTACASVAGNYLMESLWYVTTVSANTSCFTPNGWLQIYFKSAIVFNCGVDSFPFNGITHPNCFITHLQHSNVGSGASVAGYRFYKMTEGTNFID